MKSNVKFENTYQLTATKKFPDSAVKNIIRDVLESYLVDQKYEPEICRQMTKTLSEVTKYLISLFLHRFLFKYYITLKSIRI